MTEIYLNLNRDTLESTKKDAERRDREDSGDESDGYKYPTCQIVSEEINFDSGSFEIFGDLNETLSGRTLGYISLTVTPDMDLVIDLIEFYMKKLGKLKTVLEATK